MAKLSLILLVHSSLLLHSLSSYSQPNVIKFRFFLQDKYADPGRTAYPVAQTNITSTSPTSFGEVSVVDDLLTVGPEPDSNLIGYAQGIIANTDKNVQAHHSTITFFFTGGQYNGSSFNMLGRNGVSQKIREIPIVGGTGDFALALGIITTSNYSSDPKTGRATYLFDIAIVKGNVMGVD